MKEMVPFDTENEISNWKTSLFNSGNFTEENLDELESHLRDEMDQILTKDLTAEEKLMVSIKRIGSTETLKAAYQPFSFRSLLPFLTAIAMIILFRLSASIMLWAGIYFYDTFSVSDNLNQVLTVFFQLGSAAFIFLVYKHIMKVSRQERIKSQVLLAKYLIGTGLIWILAFAIPSASTVSAYVWAESYMAKSIMDILFISVFIIAFIVSTLRQRKLTLKAA